MKKIEGILAIGLFYLLTLGISILLYRVIFKLPLDSNWNQSGVFIGTFMIIVPYVLYGLMSRYIFENQLKDVLIISGSFAVLERVCISIIGLKYTWNGYGADNLIQFIRGEALPYFSPLYIFGGCIISILISISIVVKGQPKSKFQDN